VKESSYGAGRFGRPMVGKWICDSWGSI